MRNTNRQIQAISRDSHWFESIEFERGTIVHAEFEFGPHYAIVWERDGGGHVKLLVVSQKSRLAERSDTLKIEPSNNVPWKRNSFVKCEEKIRVPIAKIQKVYSGLLPDNMIEEIKKMVEGR